MRRGWLLRAVLKLVPQSWRDVVFSDLDDEARALGRGSAWISWHTLRAAIRLRWAATGDMAATDLRYAVRSLLRARGFALAAVFTLTLGIAVNLTVFSVVDRALFRPLPFAHMDRLAFVWPFSPETGAKTGSFNRRLFIETRRSAASVEDMAYAGFSYSFQVGGDSTGSPTLQLTECTYNFLDVLGVVPVIGRRFQRSDATERIGVAMITHDAWQSRFGGDPAVLGATLRYRDTTHSIVGVLPPGFIVPAMSRDDRFDGLTLTWDTMDSAGVRGGVFPSVARLAPGAAIDVAQQQFDALAAGLDAELASPDTGRGPRVLVEDLRAGMFWGVYQYLWLATLAASLVGLLACANLSNLLLARGRSRERHVALRASLGASTTRLIAAEMMQAFVACALATVVSLVLMLWLFGALPALVPGYYRQFLVTTIDARLAGFALLLALATAVTAGVLPAWRAARADLMTVIRRTAGAPVRRRRNWIGSPILVFEAAVGIVLVAGAAAAGRSFAGLAQTDPGFRPAGLHVVSVEPRAQHRGGDDAAELARYRGILDVIRRRPDVVRAAGVDVMPSGGMAPMMGANWNGGASIGLWQMTDGLLDTIGATIVAGRDVSRDDVDRTRDVALVSQAAARQLWPGATDAQVPGRELRASDQPTRTVIGVVGDIQERPDRPARPMVFVPATGRLDIWFLDLVVRTRDGAPLNVDVLREELTALGVTSVTTRPAGGSIRNALEQPRAQAIIFSSFAVVGLLLAGLGLFAVVSVDVAQRRSEMGIRVALGATASRLRSAVIRGALVPVLVGSSAGILVAWWAAQFMQAMVHQVDARDPWTLALVVTVLVATAVAAAWIPARRAARTDPANVLRAQ